MVREGHASTRYFVAIPISCSSLELKTLTGALRRAAPLCRTETICLITTSICRVLNTLLYRSCSNWTCQSTSCGILGTFVVTSVLKHKDIGTIHERAWGPAPDGAPLKSDMPRTAQSGCMLMQSIYDLIDKPHTELCEPRVYLVDGHGYLVDAAD